MGLALCRGERATEGRSEGLSWPPWGDETNPSGGAVAVGVVIIVESGAFFVVKIINLKETDNFNSNSIVVFTHICGYSFKSKLGNMLSGRNNLCPKCEKSSRVKPTEELLQLIKEKGCELIDK